MGKQRDCDLCGGKVHDTGETLEAIGRFRCEECKAINVRKIKPA